MALKLIDTNQDYYNPNEKNINEILPEELLIEIFKHFQLCDLYRIRQVCRVWYHMVNEYILKKRPNLILCQKASLIDRNFTKQEFYESYHVYNYKLILPLMLKYHQNVRYLKIKNFDISDNNDWLSNEYLKLLKNLQTLILIDCRLSSQTLLNESLKNLIELQLIDINIDEESLSEIGNNLQQLKYLKVSGNSRITGKFLANFPPTLNTLILRGCQLDYEIFMDSLRHLSQNDCKLQCLNIKYSMICDYKSTYIDWMHDSLKYLIELKLSDCSFLTDLNMNILENLERLTLEHFADVDSFLNNTFFKKFFTYSTKLQQLHISSIYPYRSTIIDDECLAQALSLCPKLQSLRLYIRDVSSRKNPLTMQVISELKSLKSLEIGYLNIDNDTAMSIIKNCNHLQTFVIKFYEFWGIQNLNERFIFDCIEYFSRNKTRPKLNLIIEFSLIPPNFEKNLTIIPHNLKIQILNSYKSIK